MCEENIKIPKGAQAMEVTGETEEPGFLVTEARFLPHC